MFALTLVSVVKAAAHPDPDHPSSDDADRTVPWKAPLYFLAIRFPPSALRPVRV